MQNRRGRRFGLVVEEAAARYRTAAWVHHTAGSARSFLPVRAGEGEEKTEERERVNDGLNDSPPYNRTSFST